MVLTKCFSSDQRPRLWAAACRPGHWFPPTPILGTTAGHPSCPSLSPPLHVIYGDWETLSEQAPSVPEVMEEYSCDKFTGHWKTL